jgi:hypothetical protein
MIKTFRGLLASGAQERIRLQTIDGKKGYKIIKFQVFPGDPGSEHYEGTFKVYSVKQTVVDNNVSFSEQTLLASAYYQDDNAKHYNSSVDIVFDEVIFNQDIFVTYIGTDGATAAMNFYMELKRTNLDDVEASAVILKNFRNTNTV